MKVFKNEKCRQRLLRSYDDLLVRWGVSVEESDVMTRYGSTHIITAGDPNLPPLTLFHGVGDNSALMWILNARPWARCFHIVAVDTLGGPGKSVPGERYQREFQLLPWIDDVLDALSIEKTHLAGVSNGAYMAQAYAARRPQRVLRTVCMAGGLAAGTTSPMKVMMNMMRVFMPEALFPTDRNMKKLIGKLMGANRAVFTDDAQLMEHWACLLRGFNQRSMTPHRVEPLLGGEIDNLRGKTLFLIGDRDPLGYSAASVTLLDRYRLDYRILADTGHGINHEQADRVNDLLADFLLDKQTTAQAQ